MGNLHREIDEFTQAAAELKKAWLGLTELEKENYKRQFPFDKELTEVVDDIMKWRDAVK
ncbi:hypothetical protein B0H94_103165 [Salsuginibacillus halophilus]|uniref:Uncharacterized protein n=1 Tax=Salsuginibacillus halophilus TaxID=517424 RepID=A0A2P8HWE5_9BACI|nr:hypothetical protein [Salsuginibacillus halophilus]PSL50553.1 hypothetical protein B0H94_103165 [Salsuginibacillus halophilus]